MMMLAVQKYTHSRSKNKLNIIKKTIAKKILNIMTISSVTVTHVLLDKANKTTTTTTTLIHNVKQTSMAKINTATKEFLPNPKLTITFFSTT